MTVFDYDQVMPSDIPLIVASAEIGVSILTLPQNITKITQSADGWMVILLSGIVMICIGWFTGQLIVRYPERHLSDIATQLLGVWATRILFFIYGLVMLNYFAVIIRLTGTLAKMYFFDLTPIEVLVLIFALAIIYCVSGLRIAIMRINQMFIPLILAALAIILLFSFEHIRWANFGPIFATDWRELTRGILGTLPAFNGGIVILYYGFLTKPSPLIPRQIMYGTVIVTAVYTAIFICCVGVLGLYTSINSLFPTIEMAKEVEAAGGFFERLQSILFAVWMLAIFTSAVFALDISTMMMQSVFQKMRKMPWILLLSPCGYFLAMIPRNDYEILNWSKWAGIAMFVSMMPLPFILLLAHRLKRRRATHG